MENRQRIRELEDRIFKLELSRIEDRSIFINLIENNQKNIMGIVGVLDEITKTIDELVSREVRRR